MLFDNFFEWIAHFASCSILKIVLALSEVLDEQETNIILSLYTEPVD
jgi:hypothetical protein